MVDKINDRRCQIASELLLMCISKRDLSLVIVVVLTTLLCQCLLYLPIVVKFIEHIMRASYLAKRLIVACFHRISTVSQLAQGAEGDVRAYSPLIILLCLSTCFLISYILFCAFILPNHALCPGACESLYSDDPVSVQQQHGLRNQSN